MTHLDRRSSDACGPPTGAWLTTFNDLVTLLLVFFVLLFSMGTLDPDKGERFRRALQSALGVLHAGDRTEVRVSAPPLPPEAQTSPPPDAAAAPRSADPEADRERRRTLALLAGLSEEAGIRVSASAQGVQISLEDHLLFEPGVARLNPRGRERLARIAGRIAPLGARIRVEGHTDDRPIHSPRFPSNWELSVARAVSVVKFFAALPAIAPYRLSAVGYGASRPLVANTDAAQRARNRRVEIILVLKKEW